MSTHFFGLTDWTFSYSHSIGRNEMAGTGFSRPVDLALAVDDVVYVLSRASEYRDDGLRITILSLDEQYISEFGSAGEGDGQMIWPTSIALDSKGNVYVTDEWLNRITVFDKDGEFLSKWGTPGSGDGQLDRPAGIRINSDDTVFISDSRNNRIQKFTLDGKYLGQFGSFGGGEGQLDMPWGICLDKDNNVYVADWRNDRIVAFSPDGKYQATFGGQHGSAVGQFNRPSSVAVDQDGEVYIADRQNDRVQVFAPDGRFMIELRGDHSLSQWGKDKLLSNPAMIRQRSLAMAHDGGQYDKAFRHACAVVVDDQYRIVVIDHANGRLQVYRKDREPVLA